MSIVRRVVLNRNLLVVIVTPLIQSFFNFLWLSFWSIYVIEFFAVSSKTYTAVRNLLEIIESVFIVISLTLGGLLADRFGRRKIIVYGSLFWIIGPIVILSSTTWVQLEIGRLITIFSYVSTPAVLALVAESIPYERRGTGFGIYGLLSFAFTGLFLLLQIPLFYLWGRAFNVWGMGLSIRTFVSISLAAAVLVFYLRRKFLTETLGVEDRRLASSIFGDFSKLFALPRVIGFLLVFVCLSTSALYLVQRHLSWYFRTSGLSFTQIGYIMSMSSLFQLILILPSGLLADKIGRKPLILLASVVLPCTALGYTVSSPPYFLPLALITGFMSGLGGLASTPWKVLTVDLTPAARRAIIFGLFAVPGEVINLLVSMMDWHDNPTFPFQLSFVVGLLSALIFYKLIKEPELRER